MSTVKTDFEKIYETFVMLFKHEPAWATVAEADLAFIAPAIHSIVTRIDNVTDAEVSKLILLIQKDMVLATKFIQASDSSNNLTDVLDSIGNNLSDLLKLAAVKSSKAFNDISVYVNYIGTEIKAIVSMLPTKTS